MPSEVDDLRKQVEEYRQRELESLREQLAEAKAAAAHYRAEAERNAAIGRQIAAEAEKTIADLRARLDTLEGLRNARRPVR